MNARLLQKAAGLWRPLEIGREVELKHYRRGERGVVVERIGDSLTGFARYGVRLDSTRNIADLCRYEIKGIKRNGRPAIAPL